MAGPCPENSPHGWWKSIAAAVILVPDWHVRLLLSAYRMPGTVPAWLAQCRMNPAPRLGQGACCPSCTSHTVPPGLPAPREKSRGTPSTCSQTSASPARAGLGWGRWTQPGRTHRHTHSLCGLPRSSRLPVGSRLTQGPCQSLQGISHATPEGSRSHGLHRKTHMQQICL